MPLTLIVAAALAFAVAGSPSRHHPQSQADRKRANVVVLIIDDVRWDSLGIAGNRVVQTPRIDRLAADGVYFRQARVATSICMVSRASLLTGQYMSRHGIDRFGKPLTPEQFADTYVGALRRAGYWAGHVGKYDVGPPRAGDYDFLRAYHGRHWIADPGGERVHVTEKNARDSLEFLRQRPKDRPFLLTVGYFAAHAEDSATDQYLPQDWSAKFYEGVTIPRPLHGAEHYFTALPPFLASEANEGRVRYHWRFDTAASYQQYMTRYYRLITEVDDAIGRLVDELKAQGVYDNTLIIFIGDNGYFQSDRGLADKWYPYEESIRVPLVVFDPRARGAERGSTRDETALNIDVAPTILSAAGLPASRFAQGEDLSRLYLQGSAPAWRDEFFYEHPTVLGKDRIPSSRGVVRRDWKYVFWPEFDYEQLFDLSSDPDEIQNLAAAPAAAGQVTAMRRKLREWQQRVR
jgi:arylsulfatase